LGKSADGFVAVCFAVTHKPAIILVFIKHLDVAKRQKIDVWAVVKKAHGYGNKFHIVVTGIAKAPIGGRSAGNRKYLQIYLGMDGAEVPDGSSQK
jgi:hypothetical protein